MKFEPLLVNDHLIKLVLHSLPMLLLLVPFSVQGGELLLVKRTGRIGVISRTNLAV